MKFDSQNVYDAYQEWAKEELKNVSKQTYDLGKFFFGVSVGSIGFFTAIEKLNAQSLQSTFYWAAVIILILSLGIALLLVLPKKVNLKVNREIEEQYKERIKKDMTMINSWFTFWVIGVICGVLGLFL